MLHLAWSEQQELEPLRKLVLLRGVLENEEVNVLKEVDGWLGDLEAEMPIMNPCISLSMESTYSLIQARAIRKAHEVAAKCQQLLRSEGQDGRIMREV